MHVRTDFIFFFFQFIIMVIDSTDRERLAVTREELYTLLQHEDLSKACLLVYANKQVSAIHIVQSILYTRLIEQLLTNKNALSSFSVYFFVGSSVVSLPLHSIIAIEGLKRRDVCS